MTQDIIHGDALAIIKQMDDASVDAVITDPPYDFSRELQGEYIQQFDRISRGHVIVFCSPENHWEAPKYMFWVKPTSTKNFSKNHGRFVEMIAYYPREGAPFNQLFWANMTGVYNDIVEAKSTQHPFQKPLALMERLVRIHTNPGDIIIDPFAGSGTTLLACSNHNRGYIGIDIEEENIVIMKERLGHESTGQKS